MDAAFRKAGLTDMTALAGLMEEYYAYDGHDFDRASVLATLSEFLADERFGMAWLIDADGGTIGYMVLCIGYSLEFGGRDAFVDEIYLKEAWRGQGLGRKALSFMVEEAGRLGIVALHLEVDRGNERARSLYRALGFEPRERFMLMSRDC